MILRRSHHTRYCALGSVGASGVHFDSVLVIHTIAGLSLTQASGGGATPAPPNALA